MDEKKPEEKAPVKADEKKPEDTPRAVTTDERVKAEEEEALRVAPESPQGNVEADTLNEAHEERDDTGSDRFVIMSTYLGNFEHVHGDVVKREALGGDLNIQHLLDIKAIASEDDPDAQIAIRDRQVAIAAIERAKNR